MNTSSILLGFINHQSPRNLIRSITKILGNRTYTGSNPAIAAVYDAYRRSIQIMLAITFILVVFGMIVPVDSSTVAKARVVVLSNRKTVQHLEGGIVRKLLVKDGDVVTVGQPLMELSDVAPKASRSILQADLLEAQMTEARLVALRNNKPEITFGQELDEKIAHDDKVAKMAKEQTTLFTTQRDTYHGKLKALVLRADQAREEIIGLKAQAQSASSQLEIIEDEIETMEKLIAQGLSTKPRLLELKRDKQRLNGDKGQFVSTIAKTQQGISEIDVEVLNLKNDFSTQNSNELRDIQSKIADISEKLRAASDVVLRTVVTSPSEGIVNGLKFHTEGGVIAPGTPIMDIVPQHEELVIDAKINPMDIDVVTAGLEAKVVFSSYKVRSLPRLTGKVTQVSADSFTEQQGLQENSYYTAQIQVDSNQLKILAPQIKLYPGMPVEVYIRTGSRSFLGYLFAPITDSLHKAFIEK